MKYHRKFARSQWRKSFNGMNEVWHSCEREPGRTKSFRHFTGRTKAF